MTLSQSFLLAEKILELQKYNLKMFEKYTYELIIFIEKLLEEYTNFKGIALLQSASSSKNKKKKKNMIE